MDFLKQLQYKSGIKQLNESKYGQKFDQFKLPFKHDGDKVKDNTGKEICECPNAALAKEMAALLSDIRKMREICERFISLSK